MISSNYWKPSSTVAKRLLIIAALLSSNNNESKAAEKQYNDDSVPRKAILLHQLGIDTSVATEVRDMSLVLLRRLVADKINDIVTAIPAEFDQMKNQLIQSTGNERIASIRKRLTDVISDIARQTIDDDGLQQWNTVVEFIGHWGSSENAGLRETAMILVENVPNIFGVSQRRLLYEIKQMFKTSLLFNDDGTVRRAAVRAYVAFIVDNEEDPHIVKSLSDMIPDVLKVCLQIFETYLLTAANKDKDESYRQSSMEIIITLCKSTPALIREKAAAFFKPLAQECLSVTTEYEERLDEDMPVWLAEAVADPPNLTESGGRPRHRPAIKAGADKEDGVAQDKIFDGLQFILTSAARDSAPPQFTKKEVRKQIESRGGNVIETFESMNPALTTYLIADTFYRTHKYLTALSLSVPTVSFKWINKCVEENKLVDHNDFMLDAGESETTGEVYKWKPLKGKILVGKKVAVYSKRGAPPTNNGIDFCQIWPPIVVNLGAELINEYPAETEKAVEFFKNKNTTDYFIADDGTPQELINAVTEGNGIPVTSEWIIQTIISGILASTSGTESYILKPKN